MPITIEIARGHAGWRIRAWQHRGGYQHRFALVNVHSRHLCACQFERSCGCTTTMDTGHSSRKKFLTCAHLKNVLTRNLACTLISDVPNLATADISENPNVSGIGDSAGRSLVYRREFFYRIQPWGYVILECDRISIPSLWKVYSWMRFTRRVNY